MRATTAALVAARHPAVPIARHFGPAPYRSNRVERAREPLLNQGMRPAYQPVPAHVKADHHLQRQVGRARDQPVGIVQRERDRLFDEDVLARIHYRQRHFGVIPCRNAHPDSLHIGASQQLPGLGITPRNTVAFPGAMETSGVDIGECDHFDGGQVAQNAKMLLFDHVSAADHPKSYRAGMRPAIGPARRAADRKAGSAPDRSPLCWKAVRSEAAP